MQGLVRNGGSTRWERMEWRVRSCSGAALLRCSSAFYTISLLWWIGVFVDDFCLLLRKSLAEPPRSSSSWWHVDAHSAGRRQRSILHVTPHLQLVRMAPTKYELVMEVLSKMIANETFTRSELDNALGRLQWATNCCPLTKLFLQAFWQWKSAVKTSGRPNKLLRGFALLFCQRL